MDKLIIYKMQFIIRNIRDSINNTIRGPRKSTKVTYPLIGSSISRAEEEENPMEHI